VEQLFDHFSDLSALEREKASVIKIFKEIEDGIERLSNLGFKLDSAKGIAELNQANKQLEKTQNDLLNTQKKLADQQKKNVDLTAENIRLSNQASGATDGQTQAQKNYNAEQTKTAERLLDLKARLQEVRDGMKKLNEFGDVVNVNPELKAELIALTEEEANLKVQIDEANRMLRNQAKEAVANEGSVNELRAKLNQLLQTFDALSKADQKGASGQNLLSEINQITDQIKEQEFASQRFQRNVGNYANSLSPFFEKLTEQISKLKTEQKGLQDLRTSNPIGFQLSGGNDRLNQVNAELQQYNNIQQVGFKLTGNYVQQVHTLENAFEDAAKKGNLSAEAVAAFRSELSKAKGAYVGTFSGAFDVLVHELDQVRQKLKDPSLSGDQFKQLQKEEQLLTQLTEQLQQGFSSTVKELRTMTEVSKKLGTEFGTDSEIFLAFAEQVGNAKNELGDVEQILKQKASDTKFLDSAVASVNALAGAYSAAQGAQALFGDGSEDVQRTMIKLQALLTIVNGLQSIQNALQTESGAVQGVLAAKLGLVNAAKALQARFSTQTAVAAQAEAVAQGEAAAAAEASAVAQTENAAATEAAVVAEGEMAAAAGTAAIAMEGEAAAAVAATGATTAFSTALIASGIGVAIAAIIAGVVYLVAKINEWAGAGEKALKLQNDLADATKSLNDTLVEQANLYGSSDQSLRKFLQGQVDAASKAGLSQAKQFALKKQLAKEEQRLANDQVDILEATNAAQAKSLTTLENINDKKVYIQKQYNQAIANELAIAQRHNNAVKNGDVKQQLQTGKEKQDNEKQIEVLGKILESYQKQYDTEKSIYDQREQARQARDAANKNVADLQTEEAKFNADEQRKLILETTRIEVEATQDKNSLILSNERSTLGQRIAALKENLTAQKRLIEAEKTNVLNDPSTSVVDKAIAIRKAAQQEIKVTQETQKAIADTQESFRLRDLQAQKDILEQKLQLEISTNKAVAANSVFTYEQRLQALQQYTADEKRLLDANYKLKLQQAGISDTDIEKLQQDSHYKVQNKKITDEELLRLEKEYENGVLQLSVDTNKAVTDLLKQELDKQKNIRAENIQAIKQLFDSVGVGASNKYAGDVQALNNSLLKQEISVKEYNKRRLKLDAEFQRDLEASRISAIQQELNEYTDAEEKKIQAQAKVDTIKQQLEKESDPDNQIRLSNALDVAQKELDIAKESVNSKIALEQKLADARVAVQKEATAKLIELNQQLESKYAELVSQVLETFTAIGDGVYDSQKNDLQDQIDQIEKVKEADIDRINASGDAEETKAARVKLVEAKAQSDKEALERRQKQLDRQKAIFERAMGSFNIIVSGIEAVAKIKATAAVLAADPLTAPLAPLALAQIPITVATTGAQLAALLATPLPKFARGTQHSPEGWAIVGEAGREFVETPQGERKLVDKPTQLWLDRGSKVLPNPVTEKMIQSGVKPSQKPLVYSLFPFLEPKVKAIPTIAQLPVFDVAPIPVRKFYEEKKSQVKASTQKVESKRTASKSLLELSRETKVSITAHRVVSDLSRAAQSDVTRVMSAPPKMEKGTHQNNVEVLEEIKKTNKELKELNKKSRIVIINEPSIESSAYYQQQMKY
jgi:hypothetical protein